MNLVLNSISYHYCPVKERETISFTEQQRYLVLTKMYTEKRIGEAAILATCNRLEL